MSFGMILGISILHFYGNIDKKVVTNNNEIHAE